MKHYDVPLFCSHLDTRYGMLLPNLFGVTPVREALNIVYQARYGLFTCGNSHQYAGNLMYQPDLITIWEPNHKQMIFIWYLALAYAIKEGSLSFDLDLAPYRKAFNKKPKEPKSSAVKHVESSIN